MLESDSGVAAEVVSGVAAGVGVACGSYFWGSGCCGMPAGVVSGVAVGVAKGCNSGVAVASGVAVGVTMRCFRASAGPEMSAWSRLGTGDGELCRLSAGRGSRLLLTSGERRLDQGYGNNKTFDHAYRYRRTRARDIQAEM